MSPADDPLAPAREALARARARPPGDPAGARDHAEALALVDRARDAATTPSELRRALAHRAQVLDELGRGGEAGVAYAEALALDLSSAEELIEGMRELLDRFAALEAVEALVARAVVVHPGRRWQLEPLAAVARRRLELDRAAPVSGAELARIRDEVGRRLAPLPACDHADDRRPVTRAVVRSLGLDVPVVLEWLAALGACCCDCSTVGVRGPREASSGATPPGR